MLFYCHTFYNFSRWHAWPMTNSCHSRIEHFPLSIRYRLNYEKLLMEPAGIIAVISFHFLETEARGDSCLFNFGDANSDEEALRSQFSTHYVRIPSGGNFDLVNITLHYLFVSSPLPSPNFFINMKKDSIFPFPTIIITLDLDLPPLLYLDPRLRCILLRFKGSKRIAKLFLKRRKILPSSIRNHDKSQLTFITLQLQRTLEKKKKERKKKKLSE